MDNRTSRRNFISATLAGGVGASVGGMSITDALAARPGGDKVILLLVDTDLPGPPDPSQFIIPDPGLTELLDMLGGDVTYELILAEAETFYLERFGIDFSEVEPDANGFKFLDDFMLMPIRINPAIRYTATAIANNGNITVTTQIRDAAFAVIVTAEGPVPLVGTGGRYSAYVGTGLRDDLLAFGAYSIPNPGGRRPFIVQYGAAEPMRANADGNVTIACELLDSPFGPGLAYGIGKFVPMGGDTHVFVRNVLSFPGLLTSI